MRDLGFLLFFFGRKTLLAGRHEKPLQPYQILIEPSNPAVRRSRRQQLLRKFGRRGAIAPSSTTASNSMSSTPITLIRKESLRRRLGGIANSTLHDWLSPSSPRHDPTMPRPIQLGANTVAWVETEVEAWLANKVANAKKTQGNSH